MATIGRLFFFNQWQCETFFANETLHWFQDVTCSHLFFGSFYSLTNAYIYMSIKWEFFNSQCEGNNWYNPGGMCKRGWPVSVFTRIHEVVHRLSQRPVIKANCWRICTCNILPLAVVGSEVQHLSFVNASEMAELLRDTVILELLQQVWENVWRDMDQRIFSQTKQSTPVLRNANHQAWPQKPSLFHSSFWPCLQQLHSSVSHIFSKMPSRPKPIDKHIYTYLWWQNLFS